MPTSVGSCVKLMGESEAFFSASLLSDAWKQSCSVYKSRHDNPSYVRAGIRKNLVVFAFCGSLDPNRFTSTATKYGEYQINPQDNIGFLDGLKDGNDQRASVHQGSLSQFQDIWYKSGVQKENCPARLSLRAAGQVLKQQIENLANLEKEYPKKMESPMEKLEEYRLQSLRNDTGYFDAFKKKQRGNIDFQANLNRLELAGWWDEIIQNKFDKDELPDDFQCSKEWIRRGTHYRLLVEPLDIANYYRLGKNEDSGPYLTHGRPRRYKTVQKWLENDKEQPQPPSTGIDQPTMLTQDSCLWAFVEEISSLMHKNSYNDEKRTELENRMRPLIDSHGLCMEDLLTGESTFKTVVNWLWTHMTPPQRETSPFRFIIYHPQQTIQI